MSGGVSEHTFDVELAAYEVLRLWICRKPPFTESSGEYGPIPDDLKSDVELGCVVYQISVYLDLIRQKFGHAVSEKVRTHLLFLARFNPDLEAGLLKTLEGLRAAEAEFTAGGFSDVSEGPSGDLARYYTALGYVLLIDSGCPAQRRQALTAHVAECVLAARFRADDIFEPELKAAGEVSSAFQWSTNPGPFERQLQRQQGNPLFPATAREISAHQVTEARQADLKHTSKFVIEYKQLVRAISPLCDSGSLKEVSDYQKRAIDLLQDCKVLGSYHSTEAKILNDIVEGAQQDVMRLTGNPGLEDTYRRYRALSDISASLKNLSMALPQNTEDYSIRSVLSEDFETISNQAYFYATGVMGPPDDWFKLAEKIITEAIREGMQPDLGKRKLDAFRSGMETFESHRESGLFPRKPPFVRNPERGSRIWAALKRFIRCS